MQHKKVELLAPAGSYESMKAAVTAGADAIYMGGSQLGQGHMRIIQIRTNCWMQSDMYICMIENYI